MMQLSLWQTEFKKKKKTEIFSLSAARIVRTSSQTAKIPSTVTKTGKKELKLLFKECFEHRRTSVEKPLKSPWI